LKRIVSIFLLALLLYHTIGYFLFFQLRHSHIRKELRQVIETKTHPEQDWVVIAVPITLYHQLDRDFEIAEGEFSYQGKVYEKAMQRVRNDTLFVYCVNNRKQEKVKADLSEHLKTHVADVGGAVPKKSESLQKSFSKPYYLPQEIFCFNWTQPTPVQEFNVTITGHFDSLVAEVSTPPPRLCIV
jgi:hypothetical protein